jgi:hypothetical protein
MTEKKDSGKELMGDGDDCEEYRRCEEEEFVRFS